jgi:Ca2+-binding EF-hand superfamily protein
MADTDAYMAEHITPTLVPALAEMARAKPDDPVTWLALWLLEHKPPPKDKPPGTGAAMKGLVDMISSPEGKAELRALFDACDKDGDGSVTSKEWGKSVGKNWKTMAKFFGGATMPEVAKMFKKLDADGSGDLTWDEFELAMESMDVTMRLAEALETAEGAAELRALFDRLDKDGDGTVSSKEWGSVVAKNKELLQKYFGGKNLKAVAKAFNRIDVDGSGDLTWEEFCAASTRIIASF